MQFVDGASVFTTEGEHVGDIDRVVLDPESKRVTHLVVQKGFLFRDEKLISLSLVANATEDRVTLRPFGSDPEDLPDFEEAHYVPVERGPESPPGSAHWARPLLWYPPVGSAWPTGGVFRDDEQAYALKTRQNIPEGTVALEEGAQVISSDGQHVGDIERVFTDPLADRATHLLIAEGLLLKEKKLIPAAWLSHVLEYQVHLLVDAGFVGRLPEYQEPN
jgi:uncharacterized protein YrrD